MTGRKGIPSQLASVLHWATGDSLTVCACGCGVVVCANAKPGPGESRFPTKRACVAGKYGQG